MRPLLYLAVGLVALGFIGTGEAMAAPGALWTTPLATAGSFVYGSPQGGFLLDAWEGTYLDPEIGDSVGMEVAAPDHDPGVAPVFDSVGDIYRWGSTITGSTEEMALEEDSPSGQVLWRTPVDAEQPHDVILGSGQDLYASYFANDGRWHLLRLDANTGQVLWNDVGPEGIPEPTPTGVALVSPGQVQLVGSDESNGGTVTYATGETPELYSVAHNDQGDILALNLPRWANESCGYTPGPATLTELDPRATQLWTRTITMSGCIHPTVVALPNGSWAVSDQENGEILGISGMDGSTLWTASTQPHNYGPFILGADANGDIYADQNLVTNCTSEPTYTANCQGQEIVQINSSTGSYSTVLQLIDTSSPNTMTLGLENMPPGRDTNTPASIAPGRLLTVEDDLIGDPGSFTNSLWSFNGYSLPAGAPYPTPPDETISAGSGLTGSPESPLGAGGSGAGGGGSGSSGSGATHRLPIVLVPGINSETRETTPTSPCPTEEPFRAMCLVLREAGYPVFVVSSSKGPSSKAILNSWGDIPTNALKLAQYLRAKVPRPPLVVAHSMGGLISRVALIHGDAAGLFTVGTPYDGSFFADWDADFVGICSVLRLAIEKVTCGVVESHLRPKWPVGTEAAAELTKSERSRESALLPAPTYPLWTVAGTPISLPPLVGTALFGSNVGYYFPNDLVVGETSAWGVDAGLGPTCPDELASVTTGCDHRLSVPAYHVWKSPGETSDPEIIADVMEVAGMLESQAQPNATAAAVRPPAQSTVLTSDMASAARIRHRKAQTKPSVHAITLTSVDGGVAQVSQSVSVPTQGMVVSDHPFTASCGRATWVAENVAPQVWAMVGGALQCAVVARIPTGAGYLMATSSPRTSIRVTAITRNQDVTIRVSGSQQLL
jgi:pimeloyl-ACP methyl ester carboxylesterase